jgi:hypothetical protein
MSFALRVSAADTNLWNTVPFLTCTSGVAELNLALECTATPEVDIFAAVSALLANHVPAGASSLELTNGFRSTAWLRKAVVVVEPKASKVTPSCIIAFTNSSSEVRMSLSPDPKTKEDVIGLFDGTFRSHISGFEIKTHNSGWLILFSRGPEYDYLELYGEKRSEFLPRRKAKCRMVQQGEPYQMKGSADE